MTTIANSSISGYGIFAMREIVKSKFIGVWISRIPVGRSLSENGWYESPHLGRYCNHSNQPNTAIVIENDGLLLYSLGISVGEEVLVDYRWSQLYCDYPIDVNF